MSEEVGDKEVAEAAESLQSLNVDGSKDGDTQDKQKGILLLLENTK